MVGTRVPRELSREIERAWSVGKEKVEKELEEVRMENLGKATESAAVAETLGFLEKQGLIEKTRLPTRRCSDGGILNCENTRLASERIWDEEKAKPRLGAPDIRLRLIMACSAERIAQYLLEWAGYTDSEAPDGPLDVDAEVARTQKARLAALKARSEAQARYEELIVEQAHAELEAARALLAQATSGRGGDPE